MLTAYETSAGVAVRGLAILDALLGKGEDHVAATGADPATLLAARLAPDMMTLTEQVQRACDTANLGVARLSGLGTLAFPDEERSFDELHSRIARTIAQIETVPPEAIEAGLARVIELKIRGGISMSGQHYLLRLMLPNFFFHVATAHGILRNQGVPIGKPDYLGAF